VTQEVQKPNVTAFAKLHSSSEVSSTKQYLLRFFLKWTDKGRLKTILHADPKPSESWVSQHTDGKRVGCHMQMLARPRGMSVVWA